MIRYLVSRQKPKFLAFALGLLISTVNGARSVDVSKITFSRIEIQGEFLNLRPTGRKNVSAVNKSISMQIKRFMLPSLRDICPIAIFERLNDVLSAQQKELSITDIYQDNLSTAERNTVFRKFSAMAGIRSELYEKATLHGLRVGVSMVLTSLGFSNTEIMNHCGWSNESSLQRYTYGLDLNEIKNQMRSFIDGKNLPIQDAIQIALAFSFSSEATKLFDTWRLVTVSARGR